MEVTATIERLVNTEVLSAPNASGARIWLLGVRTPRLRRITRKARCPTASVRRRPISKAIHKVGPGLVERPRRLTATVGKPTSIAAYPVL